MYYDDDNFIGDDEFDDLIESSRESLRRNIVQHIEKTKDYGRKEVGDPVLVWDHSRLAYADTNEPVVDLLELSLIVLHPSIVVETGCKHDATLYIGDRSYSVNLDLKIWNKSIDKVYRTSSDFVKRV